MFFRPHGRQVLLLHSYRAHQGRVRHRQVWRFPSFQAFREAAVGWEQLVGELRPRCAEWKVNWEQLRLRALDLCQQLPEGRPTRSTSGQRIRAMARELARALECGENQHLVEAELRRIQARIAGLEPWREQLLQQRASLPQQRGRFDPADPTVQSYREQLRSWGEQFWQQGDFQAALEVHARWVQDCPEAEARNRYGALLQLLGRSDEALAQYRQQPVHDATSLYHKAALLHDQPRLSEAMDCLLAAMLKDQSVVHELERLEKGGHPQPGGYWYRYGCLWSAQARQFALDIFSLMAVKSRLREIRQTGIRLRYLIRPCYLHLFKKKLGIAGSHPGAANSGG